MLNKEELKKYLDEANELLNKAMTTADANAAWKLVDLLWDQRLLQELEKRL